MCLVFGCYVSWWRSCSLTQLLMDTRKPPKFGAQTSFYMFWYWYYLPTFRSGTFQSGASWEMPTFSLLSRPDDNHSPAPLYYIMCTFIPPCSIFSLSRWHCLIVYNEHIVQYLFLATKLQTLNSSIPLWRAYTGYFWTRGYPTVQCGRPLNWVVQWMVVTVFLSFRQQIKAGSIFAFLVN